MKKITAILAASMATASIASAQELSVSSTVGWESTYVFRGVQLAEEYFSASVDVSYGDFYTGVWTALPVDSDPSFMRTHTLGSYDTEFDLYAGYVMGIDEMMSADFGFTYYTYPKREDDFFDSDVNTFEIYTGLSFDVPFSPSVYVFYDFDLENLTVEGSAGHSIEVAQNSSVDLSVHLGWVDQDDGPSYFYYGAGVAYVYAFSDNASFSVGGNYYGAEEDYMGRWYDSDYKFTWSASFTAGF